MPDLQVKETCQRLSGLSQLINRLGEVEESFGLDDDITSSTDKEPPKRKQGKDSELICSLGSEILQRIREVLWKPDSGYESEVDILSKFATLMIAEAQRQLIAKSKIDGTETSINRDGSDERCESNVGEQSQDFGEDFCTQFLNGDAFS